MEELEPGGAKSVFRDGEGRMLGFAVGGTRYPERADLLKSHAEELSQSGIKPA